MVFFSKLVFEFVKCYSSCILFEDPKTGYMPLLCKRSMVTEDSGDDGRDKVTAECDRVNCSKASAPIST